jgi:hypothetical protein
MRSETEYLESMRRLRRLVLSGVPSDEVSTALGAPGAARESVKMSRAGCRLPVWLSVSIDAQAHVVLLASQFVTPYGPTRPLLWKLLLRVSCPAGPYLTLVAKGPSTAHAKIRNDTFRTLATDQGFKRRVDEGMLVRLLEAFVWRNDGESARVQLAA